METKTMPAFRKTAPTAAAGAKALSQKYFVSAEIFSQEQEQIFSKQWLLVGHGSQIAKPGQYFLAQIAGESLIIGAPD
jgi:phenylpropionate dioxygenase-like ring-hydroxylating dioxygenase large terminal subunit